MCEHIRFIKKRGVDFSKHFINEVDEIQEKSEKKEALEKTNDTVRTLSEQLEKIKKDLDVLENETIKAKDRTIFQTEQKRDNAHKIYDDNVNIILPIGEKDTTKFEQENADLLNVTYDTIAIAQRQYQERLQQEESEAKKDKNRIENDKKIGLYLKKNNYLIKYINDNPGYIITSQNFSFYDYQQMYLDRFSGYYGNFFQILSSFSNCSILQVVFLIFQIMAFPSYDPLINSLFLVQNSLYFLVPNIVSITTRIISTCI